MILLLTVSYIPSQYTCLQLYRFLVLFSPNLSASSWASFFSGPAHLISLSAHLALFCNLCVFYNTYYSGSMWQSNSLFHTQVAELRWRKCHIFWICATINISSSSWAPKGCTIISIFDQISFPFLGLPFPNLHFSSWTPSYLFQSQQVECSSNSSQLHTYIQFLSPVSKYYVPLSRQAQTFYLLF